ncbi:MAG: L-rhamnose mutarotase [Rhodothermales bacterium]|nr:L-rhamnose mutarotase [Rhodothermales bacterium]
MPSLALTLNLKDDPSVIQAYRDYHARAWPEVVEALQAVGIHQMRIWLLGRRLFMVADVAEGFEPAVDFPRYLTLHPRCQEWEDLMGTLQEPVPEAKPGEKWAEMEEVFRLAISE